MKTLSERLKYAMKLRGETQDSLSQKIGAVQGTISKLITDKSIESTFIVRICKVLDCDPFWLELNEGFPPDSKRIKGQVPIISWENVGFWNQYFEIDLIIKDNEFISVPYESNKKQFGLRIKDDSMIYTFPGSRTFLINDIIIIDPEKKEPKPGEFVLIALPDAKEPVFRQFYLIGDETFFRPLNGQFPMIKYDKKNIIVYGVVTSHLDILSK